METMAAIATQRMEEKERDTIKELDTLKRQMIGLSKQFTIMMTKQNRQSAPTAQRNQRVVQRTETQPPI